MLRDGEGSELDGIGMLKAYPSSTLLPLIDRYGSFLLQLAATPRREAS